MGLVSLANPLQHCAAVRLHAVKEAMPPEQHRVAMYLQRGRRLAKRVRRHHLGVKTEPFFFLAQPCQGGSRQGVEGALACPTAVALQPTGLTMQIKVRALASRAAARLACLLGLNDREFFLVCIKRIKPLSC